MPSISDLALSGAAVNLEQVHGETFYILSGDDAGKQFVGILEIQPDFILDAELGQDPRAKRFVRFRIPNVPHLESQDQIQDSSGKKWHAVRRPGEHYLFVDFELSEIR